MAKGWFKGDVAGRLGKDPELRTTTGGKSVCSVSVGVTVFSNGKNETLWVDVSAWGKTGEYLAKYGHKGDFIVARGDMTLNKWTDRTGGQRISWRVQVTTDIILVPKSSPEFDDEEPLE